MQTIWPSAAAIRRLFAREPRVLRAAAKQAATVVMSDVDHTRELVALYQKMIDHRDGRLRVVA